jgi:hypothetical protein
MHARVEKERNELKSFRRLEYPRIMTTFNTITSEMVLMPVTKVLSGLMVAMTPLLFGNPPVRSTFPQAATNMSTPAIRDSIGELLPLTIRGWRSHEPPQSYLGQKIYDYMDGAGEIYRAYNFRELRVQRYSRSNQPDILLEVFDMETPHYAFGVFTYMLGRGPSVSFGQGGEYKSGLLTFWKGRFFVCVMIEDENEEAKSALLELGEAVADSIRERGEAPSLLSYLPTEEYLPNSLRYFFRHDMLNIHYSLAEDNCLLLENGAEGVLVRMKEDRSYLLLVGYPNDTHADRAYRQFCDRFVPEGKPREISSGKWRSCIKKGRYVAVILDASSLSYGQRLQESMARRLP